MAEVAAGNPVVDRPAAGAARSGMTGRWGSDAADDDGGGRGRGRSGKGTDRWGQPIKAEEVGIGSIDRQLGRIDPRVLTNYPGSRAVFIE
jgi:hypothetical protein